MTIREDIEKSLFRKPWDKAKGFDNQYIWHRTFPAKVGSPEIEKYKKEFRSILENFGATGQITEPRRDCPHMVLYMRLSPKQYKEHVEPNLAKPSSTPKGMKIKPIEMNAQISK